MINAVCLGNIPCVSAIWHKDSGVPSRGNGGFINAHPTFDAFAENRTGHHSYVASQATVTKTHVVSLVDSLLGRSGPSAIARLIATIVVDTVDGVSACRRWTHVGKERFKATSPALADKYSATTVQIKRAVTCVMASRYHFLPSHVLFCDSALPGLTMRNRGCFADFFGVAPAGLSIAAFQTSGPDNKPSAAIALTHPCGVSTDVVSSTLDKQSPKQLTSQVNEFTHFVTSKLLTVKGAWQSAVRPFFGSYPSHAT